MTATPVIAPLWASATVGAGIKVTSVTASNVRSSITINPPEEANAILVTNAGTNAAGGDPGTGTVVFVRISGEAAPTATNADVPVLPGNSVIFANPVPTGTVGIAIKGSGTTANDLFFTPVEIKLWI